MNNDLLQQTRQIQQFRIPNHKKYRMRSELVWSPLPQQPMHKTSGFAVVSNLRQSLMFKDDFGPGGDFTWFCHRSKDADQFIIHCNTRTIVHCTKVPGIEMSTNEHVTIYSESSSVKVTLASLTIVQPGSIWPGIVPMTLWTSRMSNELCDAICTDLYEKVVSGEVASAIREKKVARTVHWLEDRRTRSWFHLILPSNSLLPFDLSFDWKGWEPRIVENVIISQTEFFFD